MDLRGASEGRGRVWGCGLALPPLGDAGEGDAGSGMPAPTLGVRALLGEGMPDGCIV